MSALRPDPSEPEGVEVKKFILLVGLTMVFPKHPPMFPGMIVRCDETGNCHWECEFGILTETTTVNENLVVKPSGCAPKLQPSPETIKAPAPFWYRDNAIPL